MPPGESRVKRKQRHQEAVDRNSYWAALTPEQQWAELNKIHGKNRGASSQRKRLLKKLPTLQWTPPPYSGLA